MSREPSKADQPADAGPGASVDQAAEPGAGRARGSLKDRIADLQLASKASAARASFAERMKAVQDAAPAAAELKDKLKGAAAAVRIDKLNRDTLKAGRDGLAAKVEALLKPRPVDATPSPAAPAPAPAMVPPPPQVASTGTPGNAVQPTPATAARTVTTAPVMDALDGRRDVRLLKARVDDALKSSSVTQTPGLAATETTQSRPAAAHVAAQPDIAIDRDAETAATAVAATAPNMNTAARIPGTTVVPKALSSRLATLKSAIVARTASASRTTSPNEHSVSAGNAAAATAAQASVAPLVSDAGAEPVSEPVTAPVTSRSRRFDTKRIVQAEAQAERSRPIFSLGLFATALTAGGVLHILTTFAVPWFNAGSAFERLRWQLEPNAMRIFEANANGQTPLPFLTADMRYAICRYDLTSTSVQVSAVLPDIGWSLTLYTPQGDNFYAVPGQDGKIVTAQFTLSTASDRLLLPMPGVRRSDTDATQVTSPQRQGLIVLRAPNLGPAQQRAVDEALKRSWCRVTSRR